MVGSSRFDSRPHVRLFIDEILPTLNAAGEMWSYIGVLAVPQTEYESVLADLQTDRAEVGYVGELHFRQLKNRSDAHVYNEKTLLAKRWAERVMSDKRKALHFHVLGLNRNRLNIRAFGSSAVQERNAYNRFFRASLLWALKYFFGMKGIVVQYVFHDSGSLDNDAFFYRQAVQQISREEPQIHFIRSGVTFINSDHRLEARFPRDSHLMQLCDVLLGGLSLCLDGRTVKQGCREVADSLMPLAELLTDEHKWRSPGSAYNHAGRMSMRFFPSEDIVPEGDDEAPDRPLMYINRPLLLKRKVSA